MLHKKKVMAFGTFDILHPGHIYFLKRARALGDFLVVSIARERNVTKIKGRKPIHTEQDRKKMLESLRLVDRVVLGDREDYLKHILREKPDVIALGYDQKVYTENLSDNLEKRGLKVRIVRIRAFGPNLYKSSKFRRAGN